MGQYTPRHLDSTIKMISSDIKDPEQEAGAHVHFEAGDQVKSNQVIIKQKRKDCLEIQLGFLQINHMYEIQVKASSSVLPNELRSAVQIDEPIPNINCRFISFHIHKDQPDSGAESSSVSMRFYFKAVKEKLVREKITLNCEDS